MPPRVAEVIKDVLLPWRMSGLHAITGCLTNLSILTCLIGLGLPGKPGDLLVSVGVLPLFPAAILLVVAEIRSNRELRRYRRVNDQLRQVDMGLLSVQDLPPDVQEDIKAHTARLYLKLRRDDR